MIHSVRLLPAAVANLGAFGGSNGLGGNGVPTSPAAKHDQVLRTFSSGTVDRMVTSSLRATVGRHSALLLKWMNNQSRNLTSIYLDRLSKALVPIWRTSPEDRAVNRSGSSAFTMRRGG